MRSSSFVKRLELGVDDLIKDDTKAPVRLNLFNSSDHNETKFLISNSFAKSENETTKVSSKILPFKDLGLSF